MSDDLLRTGASAPELRASHTDRDRVVDALSVAAGDGRLSAEELDERLEAALTARTMGELAVLTADLPTALDGGAVGGAVVEAKEVIRIEQRGASARRDADWVVPRRMEVHSDWGEVTLDFTEAVITYDTLRIDLDMRGGALTIVTRPGVVVDTDSLVTNYGKVKTRRSAESHAPVVLCVEVVGELNFGKVVVRPPRRVFGG